MSDLLAQIIEIAARYPEGTRLSVGHDGFEGNVIGYYVTREGRPGLVLQQDGTRVVHVYGEKWFSPKAETPAPDADGWIKWEGGKCPVGPDVVVEVLLRDDDVEVPCINRAGQFRWNHCGHHHDIIAYRVVG